MNEGRPFVAPRTPLESLLAEVWRDVLGIDRAGVHDNFYDLGGDSFSSLQAIARLEEKLGLRIHPVEIAQQTLGQVASTYEERAARRVAARTADREAGFDRSRPEGDREGSQRPLSDHRPAVPMRPFYFGASGAPLFGCYHAPGTDPSRECAVVLCHPMGQDYIRCHRVYRQLAVRLADGGFHVLRFDFYGCGDSDGDSEQGGIRRWLTDISWAASEIRELSGLARVCLIGLRLGGTLSMLSGAERGDVDSLVLWDPVVAGDGYLRELLSLHREMRHPWGRPVREEEGEALGFPLTHTLRAELHELGLLEIRNKPARHLLLIESDETDGCRALRMHLKRADVRVEHQRFPGSRPWWQEPSMALVLVPDLVLKSITFWLCETYP